MKKSLLLLLPILLISCNNHEPLGLSKKAANTNSVQKDKNTGTSQITNSSSRKDSILSTETIRGWFMDIESGDYTHAIVKASNGQILSFFLPPHSERFQEYLRSNRKKYFEFTYDNVKKYIPAGDIYIEAQMLRSAKKLSR